MTDRLLPEIPVQVSGLPDGPTDRADNPLAPPQMRPEGFPPQLRKVCDLATESSEAHPVAVAANCIASFSAMVGRGPIQRIGDGIVHCRPFCIVAGKSGKARKGTAETLVREVFKRTDAKLRRRTKSDARLRIHAGGLSTGEGVAFAIRDAREADDNGKGADAGVDDKRLLVIESEFANVLAHCRREGNTLSATVRNLWDGRDLEPLTKSAPTRASRPHVVIIGHITGHELRERATEGDAANGLLNRFVILFVYRPKLVPLPKPTPAHKLDALATHFADAVEAATGGNLLANCTQEVTLGDEAAELWCEQYPRLTRDRDGKLGALLARTEVYARMLAMIFALMDCRREIEPCDLHAAFAWIDYWIESVSFVFRSGDGDDELDPFATEVFQAVKARPGISLTELQEVWHRKKIKPVRAALETLLNLAPPLIVQRKDANTGGRVALRYYPAADQEAQQ
ncbi:YfjI family protein [Pseudazoarcus pumilus]|uniref:DUF3987 domain-containing protein n=1 Tax=Pseudazoarcus pumilus TaxID=2067960 RepID=A0A2I6S6C7_9RHOO|nr:DUF3987 domain-containing protein [Pseudazoarcus pumilus]AUN94817.1 hypothetical protein C0099_07655 [Pseudazoarcus pumilus]